MIDEGNGECPEQRDDLVIGLGWRTAACAICSGSLSAEGAVFQL
jgi:hypothetical protein